MDFKDILDQWEKSPEGRKAAENGRFSRILQEKERGERTAGLSEDHAAAGARPVLTRAYLATIRKMHAQDELDLHGLRSEDAVALLHAFLDEAVGRNLRVVRIVHGKGLHSQHGKSVLKDLVRQELQRSPHVLAFNKALPADGGEGALQVVLKH